MINNIFGELTLREEILIVLEKQFCILDLRLINNYEWLLSEDWYIENYLDRCIELWLLLKDTEANI